jgi:hypothetical protein
MLPAVLLCAGLLAAAPSDNSVASQDLRTYEALRLKAGKGAEAQVKLALWCEAHGLDAHRLKHLAQAMLADPANSTARGLLGLVSFGGRWEAPDKVGERVRADEKRGALLAEYDGRRDRIDAKERVARADVVRLEAKGLPGEGYAARLRANRELAQMHASIGTWCDQNGLEPEALAHFTTAVHLDPSRESSWRHLGYIRRNGRWISPEQAAAEARDERDQRQANRHWTPLLRKWKGWLGESSSARRAEAEGLLAGVTDPLAIAAILEVFPIAGPAADQARLVGMLERIDDPRSSRALAELAVTTDSSPVRTAAIEALRKRPRRDYAARLVEGIRGKIGYRIQPLQGPGSSGALVLETSRVRMIRSYDAPPVFVPGPTFWGYAGYDANGLPVVAQGIELYRMARMDSAAIAQTWQRIEERTATLIAEANVKVGVVQRRMADDLNQVEMINQQAEDDNARIIPVLQAAAGAPADLKDDAEALKGWWFDTLGYKYQAPTSKPTFTEDVSPSFYPPPEIWTCFVAGTPVQTLDGPKPIESIRVGDQVLSQDETTGALAFQPVVFLHHNPPGQTLRVWLSDGTSVACSVYHRFWRAHQGWAMARELKTGDVLRTLGGRARVETVESDVDQPLYNLDVARSRTFFAGVAHLLVHDNTLPDHRLKPFDALPRLDASGTGGSEGPLTPRRSPAP